MRLKEIMDRVGMKETGLTVALVKDAIALIQSQVDDNVATWKTNITDGTREYPFPANMIKLRSLSVKDTNDKKYKKIRRLAHSPIVSEDTDPE